MCLLTLFYRAVEDAAVVVGANREEAYARGGEPPQILEGICRSVAGIDPVAGGTWLGVNEHGVLVAVTNRRKSQPPVQPRSRGLLARELLDCRSAAAAAERAAQELGADRYAGCNFLCADPDSAIIIQAGDWLRIRPLPPGLHVLANHDVNDASDRRVSHALGWLSQHGYAAADEIVAALQALCAQTGNGSPPICLHGERGGTVSSSIVVWRGRGRRNRYLHAQGPPDRVPYVDCSALLRELTSASSSGA
jgi:uncharacterized protein with NRDE domain